MAASCTVRNDVMLLYMCSIMSQVPRRSCRSNWVLFGIAFRLFAETWLTGVYSKTRENCLMRMVPSVQQMAVTNCVCRFYTTLYIYVNVNHSACINAIQYIHISDIKIMISIIRLRMVVLEA